MRGRGAIAACVGVALLASGCGGLDRNYLREGVGTDVTSADIVATSDIQDIYFGEVCRQAGLAVRQAPNGVLLCDESLMPPGAWTVFVQAGMNDIDRRCDAYLAWLDNRRRWNEPILKQLHSTAAATAAIMGLSGVGAVPIAIVGTAFGFAQETFVNLSGRLITEINQSTVQSLVLVRQNEYRGGLRNRTIANRPAALYALRSYLRICMPMTIETEINVTMTGVDRNGIAPAPMITPSTIQSPVVRTLIESIPREGSRGRLPGVVGDDPIRVALVTGGITGTEQKLTQVTGQIIQRNVCAPDTGVLDADTREAIHQAKVGANRSKDTPTFANTNGQIETKREVEIFTAAKACNVDSRGIDRRYAAAYEKYRFPDDAAVKSLQRSLVVCDPNVKITGVFDVETRNGISAAKTKAKADPRIGPTLTNADLSTKTLNDTTHAAIRLVCF